MVKYVTSCDDDVAVRSSDTASGPAVPSFDFGLGPRRQSATSTLQDIERPWVSGRVQVLVERREQRGLALLVRLCMYPPMLRSPYRSYHAELHHLLVQHCMAVTR